MIEKLKNPFRYLPLRQAICDWMVKMYGVQYTPAQVCVTSGAKHNVFVALQAICNPGDEVILPTPSFVCYGPIAKMAGARVVEVATVSEEGFKLTPEKLRAAITPRTKLLILPFPGNPTGAVLRREELEAIAEVLRGTDIVVLSDEIYGDLTYGNEKHVSIASLPDMQERTVYISGFSKSFAMTGWRLGYVCAPTPIMKQMLKVHQYGLMCAPTVSQFAAIEAMENSDEDVAEMREDYDRRRRFLVSELQKLGLPCFDPEGAFYVFPSIRETGLSSEDFCQQLLKEQHVAIVPGNAFGESGEGFVRISYCYSIEHITEAMHRLKAFLRSRLL
jgi:aminotransferase